MATKVSNLTLLLLVMITVPWARADYFCGNSNACYMVPTGCAYGDCDFEVVWSRQENTTKFDFKIAARVSGWVAVGFSSDKNMGSDDVLMCIVDGDGAKFEHRFNTDGRTNIAAAPDSVVATETIYTEGVLSCRVERDMSLTNNGIEFDLGTDWHMLFGSGPLLSDSPVQHGEIPKITKEKVDFSELVVLVDDDLEVHDDDDDATALQAGILLLLVNAIMALMGMNL